MQSTYYCCQILTKIEMCWQILAELPSIKFCENPFTHSRVATFTQMDEQTDLMKLIGTFLQILIVN
jgi:hypothetical protein